MEGRCMKCREQVEFTPTEDKTFDTKKGKKYAKVGKCPKCGTKVFRMVSAL